MPKKHARNGVIQVNLRLDSELHKRVKVAARANNRSGNKELVERLQWSFDRETLKELIRVTIIDTLHHARRLK
jgi:Arc-like DNA binding domain